MPKNYSRGDQESRGVSRRENRLSESSHPEAKMHHEEGKKEVGPLNLRRI